MISSRNVVEELKTALEELQFVEKELKGIINLAGRDDVEINTWLLQTEIVRSEIESGRLVDGKAKLGCLQSFICGHYQPKKGEDALEMKVSITRLVDLGNNILSYRFPPRIQVVWRDGFIDFESRKSHFNKIIKGLRDENTRFIVVSGQGGMGKTKIVVEIGKKVKDEKIFDLVVWATISQCPTVRNVQVVLAEMLGLKLRESTSEAERAKALRAKILEVNKILIILDDVWEEIYEDVIGIPSQLDHKCCKIIFTTRHSQVLGDMDMKCGLEVRLVQLNQAEEWSLFCHFAKLPDYSGIGLLTLAQNIVEKCCGLPLGIVTVGSSLRDKNNLEDYTDALQKLNVQSPGREIYYCLKLCYDYLEDEDSKKCFLLCSLFPEDRGIEVERLTRYAFGLELFENVDLVDEARKRVFLSIKKLVNACLLSPVYDKEYHYVDVFSQRKQYFKMNFLVRDVALWIPKLVGTPFLMPWSQKLQRDVVGDKPSAAYLSLDLDQRFPSDLEYANLKILIAKVHEKERLPDNIFVKSALQVLDLCFLWDDVNVVTNSSLVSLQMLCNLKTLHLSVRHSSNLSTIGKLKSLEILCMDGGKHGKLPEAIGELYELRVLDISQWLDLERIPPNLLSRLEKLEEFYAPHDNGCKGSVVNVSELRSLLHLTAFTGKFDGIQSFLHDFTFRNLQSYCIMCSDYDEERYFKGITLSRSLQLDNLDGISKKLFENLFAGLEYLGIKGEMQSFQSIIPQIDETGFQVLRDLYVKGSAELKCIIDTTRSSLPREVLPNLVHLELRCLDQLKKMCLGPPPISFLGNLRGACVSNCPCVENIVPDILPVGPQLEILHVSNCDQLKHVYELDARAFHHTEFNLVLLPCPNIMQLCGLSKLESICGSPQQAYCLCKLERIELEGCDKLISVFTSTVAKNLVRLQCLRISNCSELRTIITQDDEGASLKGPCSASTRFLEEIVDINIQSCEKLRSVLPMSYLSQGFPKLESLYIENCADIEQVFGDARETMGEAAEIVMENLEFLTLVDLPILVSLLPENSCLIPSTRLLLVVNNCPKSKFEQASSGHILVKQQDSCSYAKKNGSSSTADSLAPKIGVFMFRRWNILALVLKVIIRLRTMLREVYMIRKEMKLHCCLFPVGYEFERDTLVQLWMAAGFLRKGSMEEAGNRYFDALLEEEWILPSRVDTLTKKHKYKVNVEKVLALTNETLALENTDLYTILTNENRVVNRYQSWHVSIVLSKLDQKTFEVLMKFTELRTLLFVHNYGFLLKQIPSNLFSALQYLQALDLSGSHMTELASSIGFVRHLRYLDLSFTLVERLPESITHLQELQTLKLLGCKYLHELPQGMRKLTRLRHLEFDVLGQLTSMPRGLGALTELRTLLAFIVEKMEGRSIRELKSLNNLSGVCCISGLENVSYLDVQEAALHNKKCLTHLQLRWRDFKLCTSEDRSALECMHHLRPNACLEELQILCYPGRDIPNWICNQEFEKLISITLLKCENNNITISLGLLPNLKYLNIIHMNKVAIIDGSILGRTGGFPKLENLVIDCMLSLEAWTGMEYGDFPRLSKLIMKHCPKLRTVPFFPYVHWLKHLEISHCTLIESLPRGMLSNSLETLMIDNCPMLERRFSKRGNDRYKIEHVFDIWIDMEDGEPETHYGEPDTHYGEEAQISRTGKSGGNTYGKEFSETSSSVTSGLSFGEHLSHSWGNWI